jgi:hypothetical protein
MVAFDVGSDPQVMPQYGELAAAEGVGAGAAEAPERVAATGSTPTAAATASDRAVTEMVFMASSLRTPHRRGPWLRG